MDTDIVRTAPSVRSLASLVPFAPLFAVGVVLWLFDPADDIRYPLIVWQRRSRRASSGFGFGGLSE
jgi:hypothetical protein